GVQNRTAAVRRSSCGKRPLATAVGCGRTKISTSAMATVAYPRVPPRYSTIEPRVSPNEAAMRRVVTHVIGGKLFAISHQTCGATITTKTPAVIQGAAERKYSRRLG